MMAKIVDELGYKYYQVTDSLLNDELEDIYHSSNVPRLLLNVVYEMSESITNSTSNQKENNEFSFDKMSFEIMKIIITTII